MIWPQIAKYDTLSIDIARYLYQERILIKDEVEFSYAYNKKTRA
jgi:hypothetical protein